MGKPDDKGNSIHVFGGAAETIPCPYGEPFPDLPSSFILLANTASGKTQILLNYLLRYYKDMFSRIWIFCPSIKLDPQYKPLRTYLERMTDQQKEPLMFESLDEAVLGKIIEEQRKIVESCRKRGVKIPQVAVVLDDMADSDALTKRHGGAHGGGWMTSLALRGRHLGITWFISTQNITSVGNVIRRNVRCLNCWRLRNHKEIETLCEELSGVYKPDVVMQLYQNATAEPFSFLFVRLDAKTARDMFWKRFEARLLPKEESDSDGDDGSGTLGNGPGGLQQERKTGQKTGGSTGRPQRRTGGH
jgi:hypothetical protein